MDTEIVATLQGTLGDRYRIEREIGRGGMATVYLAEDVKHRRMVALKVLHPELSAAVGPHRFRREIAIAAQLQHPHILPLLDSGESTSGPSWYTMPFVEGESLRERLVRERQIPLDDALRLTREVAAALDYAHRRGVIHRDVKPANILVGADGQALLTDFGIARDVMNLAEPVGEGRLTDAGLSLGTLEYMSPEQTAGRHDVDARTDIYALGCVLYEMLAGEPPFTGATPQALVARRLVERPLPLRAVRDRVPETVEEAVDVALSRSPADRFQTAGAFAAALGHGRGPGPAAPVGVRLGVAGESRQPAAVGARSGWWKGVGVAALAVAIISSAVFWGRRWHAQRGAGPTVAVLAVLPFENLGDSSAGYFADGVTDEIRGKLTALPGLQVIARGSSVLYRRSTKAPQEIASELGARYLLTGQVRWERVGGKSRVRVDPELVQVSQGSTPIVKWQQPFDIEVSDVLEVQSAIATDVATALNVTLGSDQQHQLAARPTKVAAAYDAFLKGEAATQSLTTHDLLGLRQGVEQYMKAVTLDPDFGIAWAQLAAAQAALYSAGSAAPDAAQATEYSVNRAQALAPDLPETLHAASEYEFYVRRDFPRVRVLDSAALARYPNDVSFLTAVAADEEDMGHFEAALARLQHAAALDPRANGKALAHTLLYLRRYPEAEVAFDARLAQYPSDLDAAEGKAMVSLGRGDLPGARATLNATLAATGDTTAVLAHFANFYGLYWVLDIPQQQRLLTLPPAAFDDDHGQWALVRAQVYWLHGDTARARVWADSARRVFADQIQSTPNSAMLRLNYGEALGYLGRRQEAIAQGERGAALLPVSANAYTGPVFQHVLAQVYVVVGEQDKTIDCLAPLVRNPYVLSTAWLRIDPTWAMLRGNARFEALTSNN